MTNNTVLNITEITLADGTVKFMPRGQKEPDTIEALERDGLIRRTFDNDGTETGITDDPASVIEWSEAQDQSRSVH